MKFLVLIHLLLFPVLAFSQSWKDSSFREDSSFQYWVGISGLHESEKDALAEAYQEALNEAAKYNFGFKHQVVENTYSNHKEHKVHQETQWQSDKILFLGIKPLRQEVLKTNGKFQAYREISYPKEEISKEKSRLAGNKPEVKEEKKAKQYSSYGLIKLQTNISHAKVFLNKSDSPESIPLSAPGEATLPTGVYYLHASAEGYEDIRQEIIVSGGMNFTNLDFKVSRGTLSFKVSPSDAKIFINKKLYKGNILDLAPGNYQVEITHPDYFSQSEELEILQGQGLYREFNLKAKKGALSISSSPANAQVFANGELVGTTPLVGVPFMSQDKQLEIIIVKEGYELKRNIVNFKPNSSLEPLHFNLNKLSP